MTEGDCGCGWKTSEERVNGDLGRHDHRLNGHAGELARMAHRIDTIEPSLRHVEKALEQILEKMDGVKEDFNTKVSEVTREIHGLRMQALISTLSFLGTGLLGLLGFALGIAKGWIG